jgi:ATP-dependent DNA ligase
MLTSHLTDQALLADRRYIAEPKFDGQRAQLHVAGGRTVPPYRRRGSHLRGMVAAYSKAAAPTRSPRFPEFV